MRYSVMVVLVAACLLAGCGDNGDGPGPDRAGNDAGKAKGSAAQPTDQPDKAEAPATSDNAGSPGAADEQATDDEANKPPRNSPPLADERTDSRQGAASFADALARIDRLKRGTRFAEALQLCRKLRGRYASPEHRGQLAERLVKLQRFSRQAPSLRYALRQIGPGNSWEGREFARRKLLDAGQLGRLLLAKAVRDGPPDQAKAAAELLRKQAAWRAIPSLLQRVAEQPDGEAADALLSTIRALLDATPKQERSAFSERFADVFGRLQEDDDFSRRRIAGLFAQLPVRWMDSAFARLNAYLDIPEAAAYLEAYFRVAAESDDPALRRWGLSRMLVLGREAPALVGWWAFDAVIDGQALDRSGHDRPAAIEGPTVVAGKYGNALRFDGGDDFARVPDAPALSGGVGAARTVSVVFKTDNADGFSPLVEKQWGGQDGDWGLSASGGRLAYYSESGGNDYHAGGGTIKAGRWHHAVMTMRQKPDTFELVLFLDGRKVVSRKETSHISAETDGDVFIGARKYKNREDQGHARAVIDDVRIYDRWLGAEEIGVMAIGAYLQPRLGGQGPEAAEALMAQLRADPSPVRTRILLTALREVWRSVSEADRESYREPARRLRELAEARRSGERLPEAWRETVDALPPWLQAEEDAEAGNAER